MAVTLATLKAYLKSAATQWSDAELTVALATETAAQLRVCRVADAVTAVAVEMDEALHRRVQCNLARRALPLGITSGSGDGEQPAYLPGKDPEVRRLEAPWRRIPVG